MIKEILLCIARVRTEVIRNKSLHLSHRTFLTREIIILKDASDPDIHGKCLLKSIPEKKDAFSNLWAHSRALHQDLACFLQRACSQRVELDLALLNQASRLV